MTKETQILQCPFCGNDDPSDDGMPEASFGVCCGERGCPIDGVVFTRRDWNTRTPAIADGADPDMPAQQLRLHFGELTDDELRLVRAAIRFANSQRADGVGVEEYKRAMAKAALCILENPYGAVTDTIWMAEDGIGGGSTLFEHLVSYIDVELDGTQEDQANALRAYISTPPQAATDEG